MRTRCLFAGALLASASSAAAAATTAAAGCTLVETGFGPAGTASVRAERVAAGLEVPWGIAFLPGGDALVTERPGRVRLLRGRTLDPAPVATIAVAEQGEGGLLGIAADPRFGENGRFYLYATVEKGGRAVNRVTRWILSGDHRSAREDRVLLDDIAAERFHDGGRIRFGPDGMLYVGTGDAGKPRSARDPRSPNGKILRIGADGEVPRDNPTPGSPVFVLGLRNVEAFDWLDARTLIIADHGPSGELGRQGGDRVLVARAGDDLGWPEAWRCEALEKMRPPALAWVKAVPPGGGSVYRGDLVPGWKGSFLLGSLRSRHVHRALVNGESLRDLSSHHGAQPSEVHQGISEIEKQSDGPHTLRCNRGPCPPAHGPPRPYHQVGDSHPRHRKGGIYIPGGGFLGWPWSLSTSSATYPSWRLAYGSV